MKPILLSGSFKRGSSWGISLTRKNADDTPVDLTGLTTRSMFRLNSVNGTVAFTLVDGAGITIADPTTGLIELSITRSQSAEIPAGSKVYFDIEQTSAADPDYEWQSLTYYFPVDEQVTR